MKVCSWNVRGCNNSLKLLEVLDFLRNNKIDIFGALKTRIREKNASKIVSSRFRSCQVLCNYSHHPNGRIWHIWNPDTVAITPLEVPAQFIHCHILHHSSCSVLDVNFVYASNASLTREDLWAPLCRLSLTDRPWLVLGTLMWLGMLGKAPGISDHSPVVVTMLPVTHCRPQFYFLDCWIADPLYTQTVRDVWNIEVHGIAMFRFFAKLKNVRLGLQKLHRSHYAHVQRRVLQARSDLEDCQLNIQAVPTCRVLLEQEHALLAVYSKLRNLEISILQQRAKFESIVHHDSNTKVFYNKIKV
ncbi:hypothetical protein RND81_06G090200 [Saponaria officinalis]|uniref:Endonuclease/exonuclease/phosphatase domain-containing protein n=1 Tax=Saponaria officinalis TaxID=3572 RepID=A0AAW1K9I2_SAPOF